MPDIDKIPEVLHKATDPYHFHYDNIPLENILQRQAVMNSQIDNNSQVLRESSGTEGNVGNRLKKSLEDNGDLKSAAIDNAEHNIGAHTDGTYLGESYVRMLESERTKLGFISDEATALKIQFNTVSTTPLFTDETLEFENSDTVTWNITAGNKVSADLAFPSTSIHQHFYDRTPADAVPSSPDLKNYKTTTVATAFISGTLRVYVNGIRLTESIGIWVPPASGPSGTWILTYFVGSPTAGTFTLNRSLAPADIIRIDFNAEF